MLIDWMTAALNSKAGPYYKCPTDAPPRGGGWGELEGLGIGRAIHQQQQYQQSVK